MGIDSLTPRYSRVYIGIDPGLTGAIALICDDWEGPVVFDMPVILKGSGSVKYEVDASGVYRMVTHNRDQKEFRFAAIERVNSMPGQSASSVFSLGDSFGSARACLACAEVPTTYVTPQKWKAFYKIGSNKEESRALASKMFPTVELGLKKHADRAEALLIANFLKTNSEKS